jgi:hypothetical protein
MKGRFPYPRKYKIAFGELPVPRIPPITKRSENIAQIHNPGCLESKTTKGTPTPKKPIIRSEELPSCDFQQDWLGLDTGLSSLQEPFE